MWREPPPFSFSVGERKIMAHFAVKKAIVPEYRGTLGIRQLAPEKTTKGTANLLDALDRDHVRRACLVQGKAGGDGDEILRLDDAQFHGFLL